MGSKGSGSKSSKFGRNSARCKIYTTKRTRFLNMIRKVKRHIKAVEKKRARYSEEKPLVKGKRKKVVQLKPDTRAEENLKRIEKQHGESYGGSIR